MLQSKAEVMQAERSRATRATSARSPPAAQAIPLPATFSDAKVIKKFGDVPDDLSAL
jgi:hypothetical protein